MLQKITEADKGQSQNIYEIRKNVFKIRKNISNRNVFLEIVVEEFIKSEKLLQILIKLLIRKYYFVNLKQICKSKNWRQIQKNILQIRKNILPRVTWASSQPASECCRIQNGGGACVS